MAIVTSQTKSGTSVGGEDSWRAPISELRKQKPVFRSEGLSLLPVEEILLEFGTNYIPPLETILELREAEVDKALTDKLFFSEILRKRGIKLEETKELEQGLLRYIDEKAEEKGLTLKDDVKRALANLMVLIAKKLDEEILEG